MLKHACILILVSLISGFCTDSKTVLAMMSIFYPNSYTLAVMTDEAKKLEWKHYDDALEFWAPCNRHLPIHKKIYYNLAGWPNRVDEKVYSRSWALSHDRCLDLTYHSDGKVKGYRFRNFAIDGVWYGYLNPEISLRDAIADEQRSMHKGRSR